VAQVQEQTAEDRGLSQHDAAAELLHRPILFAQHVWVRDELDLGWKVFIEDVIALEDFLTGGAAAEPST